MCAYTIYATAALAPDIRTSDIDMNRYLNTFMHQHIKGTCNLVYVLITDK